MEPATWAGTGTSELARRQALPLLKTGNAPYHESCLTFQISAEGTCKICGRILLY